MVADAHLTKTTDIPKHHAKQICNPKRPATYVPGRRGHRRFEFKLMPGDLLMMDNYRLLHGRTSFDSNDGERFLQGCYIDYDSTEGKLKHLARKFGL